MSAPTTTPEEGHALCPVCGLIVPESEIVQTEEVVSDRSVDVSDLPGVKDAGIRSVHVHTEGCSRCLAAEPVH